MKGIDVLFHMVYGSLMCSKEALSDRPKCEGCLQTPEMLTVRSSKQKPKPRRVLLVKLNESKGSHTGHGG